MKLSIFSFLLVFTLSFSACEKSESFKDKDDKEQDKEEKGECFDFVYPVTYLMPDGYAIIGNDKEQLNTAMKEWYDNNPEVEGKPTLQYPVEVIFDDEKSLNISDEESMWELKEDCGWDKWDKNCFELVYPISYTMPDGSTISGDNETVNDAIKAWYEANPNSEEKPELQYPVDVIFKDDDVKTIQNEEEMIAAKEYCDKKWDEDWDKDCFKLAYPISFTMPDGSSITGENEESLDDALKAWYEANPDVEDKPELQYPVDIIFEDGSTTTLASEEELVAVKEDCD